MVRIEAGACAMKLYKAANHQTGSNQEHEAYRDFTRDQKAAKSISGEAGRSSTYFFQRLYQIGFSRLVHRRKASQQAGGDRNGADKCKNGRVEADRSNSSKACRADLHQEFESG